MFRVLQQFKTGTRRVHVPNLLINWSWHNYSIIVDINESSMGNRQVSC